MSYSKIIFIVIAVLIVCVAAVLVYLTFFVHGRFKMDIGGQTPRAAGGEDNSAQNSFKSRIRGLGFFSGGVIAVLLAKLWSMQLVSSDEYLKKAEKNRTRTIKIPAPRGRILDRNGEALVENRPCLTVTGQAEVADDDIELQLLGNLLGMPKMAVKRKVQDKSQGAQSARVISMDVPRRVIAYIGEHTDVFPGVTIEERTQRFYPYGNLAAHVLGYTGPVTQEQLEKSKKNTDEGAVSYSSGDIVGQAGIELEYENVLQGIPGEQTVYVDAAGNVTDYSTTVPAQSGSDVQLNIDLKIQQGAEAGLAHAIKMAHQQGNTGCRSGAIIVSSAKDGSILAMASAPTFSPSVFIDGISNTDWEELSSEKSGYPLMNRAVSGQFMSASTIKPLSVFAALDYGIATPNSSYNCTGFWTGFGKKYGKYCWDHKGHGAVNLVSGIILSCDTVFYEIAKGFYQSEHPDGLQETYRKWGLGKKTGIDLPGEADGRIPDAKWKWDHFKSSSDEDRRWQGGDTANIAIGQGDLLVTPIQMNCVYMGLANGGDIWRPHVMKSIRSHSSSGSVIDYKPEIYLHPEEDKNWQKLVHEGLKGVIYKESPAQTKHFTNLPVEVEGKTGTGEKTKGEAPTGWFCAFAPSNDPEYVIDCIVEDGGFGSTTAMYAVRDVLGVIYDAPDTADASTQNIQ